MKPKPRGLWNFLTRKHGVSDEAQSLCFPCQGWPKDFCSGIEWFWYMRNCKSILDNGKIVFPACIKLTDRRKLCSCLRNRNKLYNLSHNFSTWDSSSSESLHFVFENTVLKWQQHETYYCKGSEVNKLGNDVFSLFICKKPISSHPIRVQ